MTEARLPIPPTGRLAEALTEVRRRSPDAVDPLVEHLLGGTSADWLASTLREYGIPIGATTIKTYRARVRDHQTRSV